MMNHIMLDLETLSTKPNAAVVAVGACFFDITTGEIGPTFYNIVKPSDAVKHGHVDGDTIAWWMKQSDEARSIFNGPAQSQRVVAYSFGAFIAEHMDEDLEEKGIKVWGNGASYDNVIIRHFFELVGEVVPWKYRADRDVRTIVEMGRMLINHDPKYSMPFEGTQHNAMDDAIHQAKYVSDIYKKLVAALPALDVINTSQ